MSLSNDVLTNSNNSNFIKKNATDSLMNEFYYNIDDLNDHQKMYDFTATGYVQSLRSLFPDKISTSYDYNINKVHQVFLIMMFMMLKVGGSSIIHPCYFLSMDSLVLMLISHLINLIYKKKTKFLNKIKDV